MEWIKDGSVVLMKDPTQEDRKKYLKALHKHRMRKLKTWLNSQRLELHSKVLEQRTKEIQALEQDMGAENWMDNYKKLKVKLVGEKIVVTPFKNVTDEARSMRNENEYFRVVAAKSQAIYEEHNDRFATPMGERVNKSRLASPLILDKKIMK